MMKSLILVRHAKSSWDFPVMDKERPLIESGIKAIINVAKESVSFLPEEYTIWSSTAKRAMETAVLFCETNSIEANRIIFKESLYTFDDHKLELEVKKCDNRIQNLILFGHNEAITNFVNKFGNKYIMNLPTAGFVMIIFEQQEWSQMSNGITSKTIFPKELE